MDVIKRDDIIEKWSNDKLLASIGKAGVELKEAERITSEIQKWVQDNYEKDMKVESITVRDKVIEFLREFDTVAAETYEQYKKPEI